MKKNDAKLEGIAYGLIAIVILLAGLGGVIKFGLDLKTHLDARAEKVVLKDSKTAMLKKLKQKEKEQVEQKEEAKVEKKVTSGKIIYEVLGQQFSPEASFGIMFENILSNITTSGIRIRSIDYNYRPSNDKILTMNVPDYNACELSFITVGSYGQLQSFFKNLTKENYLTSIHEVYIEPYDNDKRILIARFKIRLYTKMVDAKTT